MNMDSTQINNSNTLEALDCISRQAAQHKINALIDEFETIMKEIRERNVDDSVCGLCEYDGAFMSDSGNWCNECPGFERDDCFKLKDQYREEWVGSIKNLPPVQPTKTNCEYCHTDRDGYVFPLEKNSHAFIDRDKIVLKANGWRGEAKIKYCPICGRRLT